MNQVPFQFNLESPVKYVKHVEKLDTSVFPECHSIERTWSIRRGLTSERHFFYVHHDAGCKWDVLHIGIEKDKVTAERLLP